MWLLKHRRKGSFVILFVSSFLLAIPMNRLCGQNSTMGFNREQALRYIQNRDTNALAITEEYIQFALHQDHESILADAYHLRGLALKNLEHNMNAIPAFLEELQIRLKLHDNLGLAEANLSIGEGYRAIYDWTTAERYLSDAIVLFRQAGDTSGIARTLNRQAAVNIDSYDPVRMAKGYPQAMESLALSEKTGDYDLQVNNLILMGAYLGSVQQFDRALENLFNALELIKKARDQYHLSLILKNIGSVYLKAGNVSKAIEYHRLAYEDALKSGLKVYRWLGAYGLGDSYFLINEEDSGYKYHAIGLQARVEIIDEVRVRQKAMMEEQFLKEKFDRDLENQTKQKKLVTIILLLVLFSVGLVFIHLFIRNKQLRSNNQALSDRNRIIEEQKAELASVNAQKDKIYSVIAHDLRNPFNSILGFSEILDEEIGRSSKHRLQELSRNLKSAAVKFYSLLENLLQWSLLQQGMITYNPRLLSLASMADESLVTLRDCAVKKHVSLTVNISAALTVYADETMLNSILRNLVSNAVKFTPEGGAVILSAVAASDDNTEISVSDTGIGMDSATLANLYQFDRSSPRRGTAGEASSGLGLRICKEFVEQNGGTIRIESEPDKGSLFVVTLPSTSKPI